MHRGGYRVSAWKDRFLSGHPLQRLCWLFVLAVRTRKWKKSLLLSWFCILYASIRGRNLGCGLCRFDRLRTGMAGKHMQKINHAIVSTLSFLHIAPRGVKEVRR